MNLTSEQKSELLSKIDRLVQQKFYDPAFNGRDWSSLVAQYRERIVDSSSTEAFETGVNDLLAELRTSGLGLVGPKTKLTPRDAIAASFRRVPDTPSGERWVFQDVQPGGPAARAGIRPADILLAIRGQGTHPPERPAFAMHEEIPVTISRNGEQKEIAVDLKTPRPKYPENPYAEPESIVAANVPPLLAHLKVSLFPGQIGIDFANHLDRIFENEFRDSDRLLIDLRGNPGGGIGGMRLMSYFTPGQQPIGYSCDRKCVTHESNPEHFPRFSRIPKSKWEIPLLALKYGGKRSVVIQTEGRKPRKWHGRIVLLVNEHSSGAAEMVTQFAKENRLATIVGMRTAGHLVAREGFKIGNRYRLILPVAAYVSWLGTRIEGKGIEPDVPVDWSFADAVHDRDVQLERAIEVAQSL